MLKSFKQFGRPAHLRGSILGLPCQSFYTPNSENIIL